MLLLYSYDLSESRDKKIRSRGDEKIGRNDNKNWIKRENIVSEKFVYLSSLWWIEIARWKLIQFLYLHKNMRSLNVQNLHLTKANLHLNFISYSEKFYFYK